MCAAQWTIGIDVAAQSVAVSWMAVDGRPSKAQTFAQTQGGFDQLHAYLVGHGIVPAHALVVIEATGSYWITLATTLHTLGYGVSVINPAQAHAFAKALLKRLKTDAIDAQTLAQLGAALQPAPWTPPPAIYAEVYQRLAHRDALIEMRQQLRNQRHALTQLPQVVVSIRERLDMLITTLTTDIATVETEIGAQLASDAAWGASATRLQSIPGIGLITAAWLLTATLNFTVCTSAEAASAYAGLVPHAHSSGTSVHRRSRIGHTGHGRLRHTLYMAALSAAQHNPVLRPFYQRLRTQGKPAKVARCAVARKLVHLAWAVVTKQTLFDPSFAPHDPGAPG